MISKTSDLKNKKVAKLVTPKAVSSEQSGFEDLKDYTKHKLIAVKNRRILTFLPERIAARFEMCGDYLEFQRWQNIIDPQELKHTLVRANFCKNRFCPMCAWRKSRRVLAETLSRIEQLQQERKLAGLMLTLTVPNPHMSGLKETVSRMSKAWNKFRKYKAFTDATLGWVRALELMGDETAAGQAHPHYHVLVIVPTNYFSGRLYIKQEQWRKMWEQAYGRENLQVNVKRVRAKMVIDEKTGLPFFLPPLLAGALEVLKYSLKLTELNGLSDDDLRMLINQSSGLRSYATGGYLAKFKPEPIEEMDEEKWRLIATLMYYWGGQDYRLARSERPKRPLQKGELPPLRPVPDYNSFSD